MRLVNKDLTRQKIWINVSEGEFYAEIFSKVRDKKSGKMKWKTEVYWEEFDFEIDRELCNLIVKKIYRLWGLKNPELYMCFGN